MVESTKTAGLPALVDYIAFAQDRELMALLGNGKDRLLKHNFDFAHSNLSLNIIIKDCRESYLSRAS